jgi:hypothetical protein
MKPKVINLNKDKDIFNENSLEHRILDLSLPLEERIRKAVTMPSAQATADYLKCGVETIFNNRQVGKRVKSNVDGKLYAIRLVKNNLTNQ